MVFCVAYGCSNNSNKKHQKVPGITFHKFPKDEERRRLWVNAVRRENWVASEHSRLCSAHFSEDMIDRTSLSCVRLRENAVPQIFEAFPQHLQKINEDSIVKSRENKLPDETIQTIDEQMVSVKEEPVSDYEIEETENEREMCDANPFIQSSSTIETITAPNQWWSVSHTPNFIVCAKWDASYVCERKIIIEDGLIVKLFLKDHEVFNEEDLKISSILEVSSLLCEVDRYYICPGIDKFGKCLKYQKRIRDENKPVWCINCKNIQKARNYRFRKNPELGLNMEERLKTKLKAEKRRVKNTLQQNKRLKKKVERLRNRIKIFMKKDMTLDYDSTIEDIYATSDINDIENDLSTENEIDMESDIDGDQNISSPISPSEMAPITFDTDMAENATRATFNPKRLKIASGADGNARQNQSVICTPDIGETESVICNSPRTDKVHVASGTDTDGNFIKNETVIAEIYITPDL